MQKKNVAIMIHKMYGGGAEKVAANLSTYLSDENFNKKVITYNASEKGYTFGGEVIDLKSKVKKSLIGKIFTFIKRVLQTRKVKKEKQIDVTISLLSGPNLINLLSKRKDKTIISVRNFISKSSTGLYGKIHKLLIKLMYNKADKIIAVSTEIKRDLVDNFGINGDKVKVIYNFYDIDKIKTLSEEPLEQEYKSLFEHPIVITAGRLNQQKGHWHLIRAFKQVKEQIPEAKLLILGQGQLEGYLKNLSNDLDLKKDVHFLGFKINPFKYISRASVYAFPSLYEGFPNALCEAMACGIPVISTNCRSGPKEILSPNSDDKKTFNSIKYEKYGVLVPVCDGIYHNYKDKITDEEMILSNSITEMINDKQLKKYYSWYCKARVKDFDYRNIVNVWEDTILNLMSC